LKKKKKKKKKLEKKYFKKKKNIINLLIKLIKIKINFDGKYLFCYFLNKLKIDK
jgi:hypothetical protein